MPFEHPHFTDVIERSRKEKTVNQSDAPLFGGHEPMPINMTDYFPPTGLSYSEREKAPDRIEHPQDLFGDEAAALNIQSDTVELQAVCPGARDEAIHVDDQNAGLFGEFDDGEVKALDPRGQRAFDSPVDIGPVAGQHRRQIDDEDRRVRTLPQASDDRLEVVARLLGREQRRDLAFCLQPRANLRRRLARRAG